MKHRKEHHKETVPSCREHQKSSCKRKVIDCYFSNKEMTDERNQNDIKTQVFHKVQETMQPPQSLSKLMRMLQKLTEKVKDLETIVKKDK